NLEELEQLALHNNPTLVEAALLVEASRAKAQQARLWPNPTVGYIGDQINQNRTAGEFQGGFISQEIITARKRQPSGQKYDQQAPTAAFRATEQQLKVLNGVRMHYFQTLTAARRIGLRQALLDNAAEECRTTLEAFNTGFKDKAQVLLAENEMRKAQVELRTEQNHYDLMWRELAALVGVPDLPCAGLAGPLEPQGQALDWHANLTRILEDSPELLAARSHVVFDQISLRREKAETISNVTVRGDAGYNFSEPGTVAHVQVQFQPRIWNRAAAGRPWPGQHGPSWKAGVGPPDAPGDTPGSCPRRRGTRSAGAGAATRCSRGRRCSWSPPHPSPRCGRRRSGSPGRRAWRRVGRGWPAAARSPLAPGWCCA